MKYMVSVDGASAPIYEHEAQWAAEREAERLAGLGLKGNIRVLRIINILRSKEIITHQWDNEVDNCG